MKMMRPTSEPMTMPAMAPEESIATKLSCAAAVMNMGISLIRPGYRNCTSDCPLSFLFSSKSRNVGEEWID